jgi:hypothetical protein
MSAPPAPRRRLTPSGALPPAHGPLRPAVMGSLPDDRCDQCGHARDDHPEGSVDPVGPALSACVACSACDGFEESA